MGDEEITGPQNQSRHQGPPPDERERQLDRQELELQALRTALQDREDRLTKMAGSVAWRIAGLIQRLTETTLPAGTNRRRHVENLAMTAIDRWDRLRMRLARDGGPTRPSKSATDEFLISSPSVPTAAPVRPLRESNESAKVPRARSSRRFRVMYLVGTPDLESARYRVANPIEALHLVGVAANHCLEIEIADRLDEILSYDILVLFRTPWSPEVQHLVEQASKCSMAIVYDVDDLVFEPEAVPHVDAIKDWTGSRLREYKRDVQLYRKALLLCDHCTVPTPSLLARVRELGKTGHLIVNSLNREQLRIAAALPSPRPADSRITIGYFSGTHTHQADFAVASPAIARILEEFPDCGLHVGGHLDLDPFPELEPFRARIDESPFCHWKELPARMATVDINLAPLEPNNPFCDAKSELKYFEAAMLAIPTIASPTSAFSSAIEHGRTGLLALDEDDWYNSMRKLLVDPDLRRTIGCRAREQATRRYAPERLARDAVEVYRAIVCNQRDRQGTPADALCVSFVLTSPEAGSGGHKVVFLMANELVKQGHAVTVSITNDENRWSPMRLREFVGEHFCEPLFQTALANQLGASDALVATHYSTVPIVREHSHLAAESFYFVQDFEPHFNPMGGEYLKAEATYRAGLHIIAFGDWMKATLDRRFSLAVSCVPFYVERDIYFSDDTPRCARILFLARPEMPRHCFELGVAALDTFHRTHPEVEIVFFGSRHSAACSVPFPHKDLGVVPKHELGQHYREASLGIAFSATNPSFVPYEMMACGCPVLDIEVESQIESPKFGGRSSCFLTEADPSSVARQLTSAWVDVETRDQVASRGRAFADRLPELEGAAKTMGRVLQTAIQSQDPAGREHEDDRSRKEIVVG